VGLNAPPGPFDRWRGPLAAVLALALAAALATVAWIQVRQHRLLDLTVRFQEDSLQVSVAQVQIEYLRLRDAVRAAVDAPGAGRDPVQLRYDIFVSRVDILGAGRAEHLMTNVAEGQRIVAQVRRFVDDTDAWLGPQPSRAFDRAAAVDLLARMQPLDAALQALVLDVSHGASMRVAERYDVVRTQGRNGVVLTALLATVSVGFALVAFALLRREAQRRRALEMLTTQLRLAQREAESASLAKSAFLANMSHEIRTPFQGLLGMLELLGGDGRLSAEQQRRLATARNSAQHLLAVLDDVLDMSRLEAGTLALTAEPVDLRALLADVQALMSAPAGQKGLRLDVAVDAAVPDRVQTDGTRMRQIVFNLVSNAIKFTDRGRVWIDAGVDGGALRITVGDTGIGIDAVTRSRLFQRFSLGDASRSRRWGGTGLGLDISRSLARRRGGDIALESTPGEGSRFTVRVPLVAATPAPLPAPTPSPLPAARRLRVLAAEDNEVNREVLAAMIDMQGHEVQFAHNGLEAVSALRTRAADLVLMDLHMPEMDGIEATRAIRALPAPAGAVPIVALTADVFSDTRARCVEAGMNDFLTKPVGMAELARLLARYAAEAPPVKA